MPCGDPIGNLTPSTPALPPDVRRGSAPPSRPLQDFGLGPWFGLWPINFGQSPYQGHSPKLNFSNLRRGGAPPHIRRRSRSMKAKLILGRRSLSVEVKLILGREAAA